MTFVQSNTKVIRPARPVRLARTVHGAALGGAVLGGVGLDLTALGAGWPRWAAVAFAIAFALSVESLGRTARFFIGRE